MKVKSYKELDVWNQGIKIVQIAYGLTKKFDYLERFGLVVQVRKSAVSIPSNIAEGFMRNYSREFIQFLHVSLGSCAELDTQFIIACKMKFINDQELMDIQSHLEYKCKMLRNLVKSLRFSEHAKTSTKH